MNRDLAFSVFRSFSEGQTIHEDMLVKAAQTLEVDPREIVKEARLKSICTSVLEKKAASEDIKNYLSQACGFELPLLCKIAKLYEMRPEEVAISYLQATNFTPHEKLALDPTGQSPELRQDPELLQQSLLPENALMSQDPFGNPMYKPTPTSPDQVPPSEEGNMEQLMNNWENKDEIQAEQEQQGANQMLAQAGQQQPQPPKEQIEQALMAADAQGKAQYIAPNATPDQLQRLADNITAVEQQAGLPIKDPAQLKKIVAALDKQDKAIIDEAIKSVVEAAGQGQQEATGPLPPPAANSGQQQQPSPDTTALPEQSDLGKLAFLLSKVKNGQTRGR